MFVECKACDGSGEGVYGHSWTECVVCHGAGQVVMEIPLVPYFEAPVIPVVAVASAPKIFAKEPRGPTRCGRMAQSLSINDDTDPTGVFPDPMKRRKPVAA